ncbi:MAG: Ada metal-binding domain-containing protein [Rubrivivax sp.]|nr:Ada metal-binding domain-containing protein [Pyrinomonadaceae bacterium]
MLPPTVVGAYAQATGAALVMPVVGNRSLMIFHLPGCAWADKIPAQRREEFTSPQDARAAGLRPCRVCSP